MLLTTAKLLAPPGAESSLCPPQVCFPGTGAGLPVSPACSPETGTGPQFREALGKERLLYMVPWPSSVQPSEVLPALSSGQDEPVFTPILQLSQWHLGS